jgi:23S rRNA (uridine2552-2'-O)-methyltransferase
MAPNSSGQQTLDHLRIMNLCESVLEFAKTWLSNEGILVTKIFKGSDEQDFVKDLRRYFKSIKYCKPKASRKESNEIYIVASGFNSTPRS